MKKINGMFGIKTIQSWATKGEKIDVWACKDLFSEGYYKLRQYDAVAAEENLSEILSDMFRLFNLSGRALVLQVAGSRHMVYAKEYSDHISLTLITR